MVGKYKGRANSAIKYLVCKENSFIKIQMFKQFILFYFRQNELNKTILRFTQQLYECYLDKRIFYITCVRNLIFFLFLGDV